VRWDKGPDEAGFLERAYPGAGPFAFFTSQRVARMAINYESPRLQTIQVEGHTEIEVNIPPEERRAIAQQLFDRAFGLMGKSRPHPQIIEAEAIPGPR
jgi:hypothetical protein